MGIKIRLKKIIFEIEYLLIMVLLLTSVSKNCRLYLEKYYMCLGFVIFHELSHILVASIFNKKLAKVFISISGMKAYFKYQIINKNIIYYIKDIFIFLAGPLSNFILFIIFYKNEFVAEINLFLGILNLLPIYPLDGYNIIKMLGYIISIEKSKNIINIISILFLVMISVICVIIFFKYTNFSSIVFLIYILLINIKKQ